jgi:hypothetical protein
MTRSPFHTYTKTREFAEWIGGDNRLLAAYASADIKVFPYQIAAAMFALRSPYLKGVILADEGSLGKTYEALLVASQKWFEGKTRQLLILPGNLLEQWVKKIEEGFTLPYTVWINDDTLPEDEEDALIVTTYNHAVRYAGTIASEPWDMVIFDEADVLSKPENKTVITLKEAVGEAFKLLLTPVPITKDIMDIYGLIHFIDESILPDAKEFYKRYFRKPENYPELTQWVSQFAFRTLKSQVTEYVNFTRRIPYNQTVELTAPEQELDRLVKRFIALPVKESFPKMEQWELSLMLYHSLSSSPQAFCKTIDGAIQRTDGSEHTLLQEIRKQAEAITITGKMQVLLDTIKAIRPSKAIVFTDNLTTLHTLKKFLESKGFSVITTEQPDYADTFRRKRGHAILLATDSAAKGLDFEFCPVVINYDLLYNAIEIEQRIARCHRQGQTQDVLVVNLLCKENLADVRILELINKRVKQFDGIFGMSDPIVGNFDAPIEEVLSQIRPSSEISQAFYENLAGHKPDNKQRTANAEDMLFTTFTKEVADRITLTPEYVEEKIEELNARIWEVASDFLKERGDYDIDDNARAATLQPEERPFLFYYHTGNRNKPYWGRRQYGVGKKFRRGDRIVPTSPLVRGILKETNCADSGTTTVSTPIEQCDIAFYNVKIIANRREIATFDVLVGQTVSGRILSDEECRAIMRLPVTDWTEEEEKRTAYWLRNTVPIQKISSPVDIFVPTEELKERARSEGVQAEETERIKLRATRKKSELEHSLDDLRMDIKTAQQELDRQTGDRMQEMVIGKRVKMLEKELRGREQGLFLERMSIDVAADDEIAALSKERYDTRVTRHFVVKFDSK